MHLFRTIKKKQTVSGNFLPNVSGNNKANKAADKEQAPNKSKGKAS